MCVRFWHRALRRYSLCVSKFSSICHIPHALCMPLFCAAHLSLIVCRQPAPQITSNLNYGGSFASVSGREEFQQIWARSMIFVDSCGSFLTLSRIDWKQISAVGEKNHICVRVKYKVREKLSLAAVSKVLM